jgi:hypothetical protein
MYIPGLSRRLFPVTKFAQHGHHAIIQKHGTTLIFGPTKSPVTIAYCSRQHAMAGETGCLTCGIATICSRPRNREARLGATRPWKYLLFLDIQYPLVETGLTPGTRYSFHLLIVALLTLIM